MRNALETAAEVAYVPRRARLPGARARIHVLHAGRRRVAPLRTLLAATDLSPAARHAVARAARLARAVDARLELMHVLREDALNDVLGLPVDPIEPPRAEDARDALRQLAAEVGQPYGAMPDVRLATGRVIEEIGDHGDLIGADLVVLGGSGKDFMRRLVLGSTAEQLLRRTPRPMLVVKQQPLDDYRRVLVPVDFSPWSRASLELARAVAPHAEFVLLHVFDVPFEGRLRLAGTIDARIDEYRHQARQAALVRLRRLAAQSGLDRHAGVCRAVHGDAALRILEQAQDRGHDLIVLGKHGKNALEELLFGSVAKRVLAASTCDVIVSVEPAG